VEIIEYELVEYAKSRAEITGFAVNGLISGTSGELLLILFLT
jgi:hypothetical protein